MYCGFPAYLKLAFVIIFFESMVGVVIYRCSSPVATPGASCTDNSGYKLKDQEKSNLFKILTRDNFNAKLNCHTEANRLTVENKKEVRSFEIRIFIG